MRAFVQRHLDPASRIGEAMFGLIMALGILGAVRLGQSEATCRELLIDVLGCNVAWGVVDGVMFALLALFERGRRARIVKGVLRAPSDEAAVELIHGELGARLEPLTSPEERAQIYRWVLDIARRAKHEAPRMHREDILGGIAVALLILAMTLPIIVPFLLFSDPAIAVRLSNTIALGLLFWLGCWWGRTVGANPYRIAVGVTCVGLILVLFTIALGG